MASADNGKQQITFKFQQEGTAEGFNKLLCGVIPNGVISGGELIIINDNTVEINEMQLMIGDGNVSIHVQTTENATVHTDNTHPYIVATFNWAPLVNNYVTFDAYTYNELISLSQNKQAIILGKCEYEGTTLKSFDYTRKTWSSIYLNNDFLFDNSYNTKSPSFNVTPIEGGTNKLGFVVGVGKAIIQGKEVVKDSDTTIILTNESTERESGLFITTTVNYKRIDIAVLTSDGDIKYIMGDDSNNAKPPLFPSYGLVLAKFEYNNSDQSYITEIYGHNITNMYNNNYMSLAPNYGNAIYGSDESHKHTLYL